MACATSYFNSTLWHKSMHRFWPLWAVYLVGWLFLLPFNLLTNYFSYQSWMTDAELADRVVRLVNDIPEMLQGGVWIAAGYGLLCAMAMFGYLYNSRSAAMMHTLPMTRESLFCTQYTAGVSYFLLPHLAVSVLTLAVSLMIVPSANWGEAVRAVGVWLLTQTGTCLFFFSFAAFCAMFTGNILALPAFYGILNCLVVVIYSLLVELSRMVFFGVAYYSYDHPFVVACTPAYALTEACRWRTRYEDIPDAFGVLTSQPVEYYLQSPGVVAAYVVAGLVFAALALAVYRRHHVETAGDVVSVPLVRPVFRIGVSFCAGLCFGTFTSAFFGWADTPLLIPSILFWTAVGWFAAEMLLRKSFRVLKCWKGCLAMVAVMLLLCLACLFDWFGVESRVPDAAKVTAVAVHTDLGSPYDSGSYLDETFSSPEEVALFLAIHQAIVDNKDYYQSSRSGDDYVSISLTYDLKGGGSLRRQYYSLPIHEDEMNVPGTLTHLMAQLAANRDIVQLAYGMDALENGKVVSARLINVYQPVQEDFTRLDLDMVSQQELELLWQAVQQDFQEGTLGVRYLFDDEERYENTYYTDLRLYFEIPNEKRDPYTIYPTAEAYSIPADEEAFSMTVDFTLTPHARHTLNWLKVNGILGDQYQLMAYGSEGQLNTPEFEKLKQEYGIYDMDVYPVPIA